jgi:hypothetical protein
MVSQEDELKETRRALLMPNRVSLVASTSFISRVYVLGSSDSLISLRDSRNVVSKAVDIRKQLSADCDIERVVKLKQRDEVLLPHGGIKQFNHHASEYLSYLCFVFFTNRYVLSRFVESWQVVLHDEIFVFLGQEFISRKCHY